ACNGMQFRLECCSMQERNELRMQGGINLFNDFTRRHFEIVCLLHIENQPLKHLLRIVAVAAKTANDAMEPLLPLRIQTRDRGRKSGISEASVRYDCR